MQKHNEWLHFAHMDLKSAKLLAENDLLSPALFHTQQCAEKALKAYPDFYTSASY